MEKTNEVQGTKKLNSKAIITVLVISAFVATFNETILNVALPGIMQDMNVDAGTAQWLITAYMIVTSIMVPVTAFLIQSFKTKNLVFSALILLLIGTICVVFSKTFIMLVISRMIQASGTGMMIPIMMNTVLLVAPREKIGSAMGVCVSAVALGPAFGPIVSGIILEYFNWHALFIILIPIIIIIMILANLVLVNVGEITKPKIDYLSIILSSIGLGAIIYGISSISAGDVKVSVISFIIGIILLAIFVIRQNKLKQPMLDLTPLKYPKFVIGVLLVMISMMIIFTMNVMLPMLLEGSLGKTGFVSALALLPAIILNGAVTPIGGKVYDRYSVKWLVPLGLLIMGVAVFILSNINNETSLVKIVVIYAFICIGVGLTMSPSQTHALNQLPKEYYPHGVAIVNTFQQVSAAIGSSLFIGIMSAAQIKAMQISGTTKQVAITKGFTSATMVAFIIVIVGFILSFFFGRGENKLKTNVQ